MKKCAAALKMEGTASLPNNVDSLCMHARSVISDSLRLHGQEPARLLCAWDFPGKDTGLECHFLLQVTRVTGKYRMLHISCYGKGGNKS